MDGKLKFYASNEKSLLDSVKNTIITAFEKTEKMKLEYESKLSALQDKYDSLSVEYNCYRNSTEGQLSENKGKFEQYNNQVSYKDRYLLY
jgi:hypothetical protein